MLHKENLKYLKLIDEKNEFEVYLELDGSNKEVRKIVIDRNGYFAIVNKEVSHNNILLNKVKLENEMESFSEIKINSYIFDMTWKKILLKLDKENFIQDSNLLLLKKEIENAKIGFIASISMYASVLFIIFQFIILVLSNFLDIVIPEIINLSERVEENLLTTSTLIFEIILITAIAFHIRKNYMNIDFLDFKKNKLEFYTFNEKTLEKMLNATSIIGILSLNLLENGDGIRYFLTIINAFGLVFLIVFLLLRLLFSKKIPLRTFISVSICALQVYSGVTNKSIVDIIFLVKDFII